MDISTHLHPAQAVQAALSVLIRHPRETRSDNCCCHKLHDKGTHSKYSKDDFAMQRPTAMGTRRAKRICKPTQQTTCKQEKRIKDNQEGRKHVNTCYHTQGQLCTFAGTWDPGMRHSDRDPFKGAAAPINRLLALTESYTTHLNTIRAITPLSLQSEKTDEEN